MAKKIKSLTGGVVPMFAWKLPAEIAAYKVAKMPAAQWINVIKGFAQKGLKSAEIEDSKIIAHLEERAGKQLTREELAEYASYALPAIKELTLSGSDVKYKSWSWARGADFKNYNETLFYFPTIVEDYSDRIADLDEAISAINFMPDVLGEDPDMVLRLDEKREELLAKQKEQINGLSGSAAHASTTTHFSQNLTAICPDARADFAHMRWSVMEKNGERILFVHEIQSDWAQRGRAEAARMQREEMHTEINRYLDRMTPEEKALVPRIRTGSQAALTDEDAARERALDAAENALYEKYVGPVPGAPEWKGSYKKAPLVSETEHWASFCVRRAMFLAIENQCTGLTWINGPSMVNGGGQGSTGAGEFYMKIVCNIAKKLAKPFRSELVLKDYQLDRGAGNIVTKRMAVMPINTEMREKMISRVQVYSYANVVTNASFDPVRAEQLRIALQARSDKMFGENQIMRVKVVSEILNACNEQRPAGALIGKIAEIAFGAEDPVMAMHHEAFHFSCKYHFTSKEKQEIFKHFEPGTPLLTRTVRLLMDDGNYDAALQCSRNPEEAAAHAFSLWKAGFMPMSKIEQIVADHVRAPVMKIIGKYFPKANTFVNDIADWIRGSSASPTDFVASIVRAHAQGRNSTQAHQSQQVQPDSEHDQQGLHHDEDGDDADLGSPGQIYS